SCRRRPATARLLQDEAGCASFLRAASCETVCPYDPQICCAPGPAHPGRTRRLHRGDGVAKTLVESAAVQLSCSSARRTQPAAPGLRFAAATHARCNG